VIGTNTMIKSAPDGLTLSIVSNNHVIYPSVLKSVPFDPINDITPIAVLGSTPLVLVVNPKVPATNAKELIALIRSKPDAINYGSSGNGTILHLAAEMFLDEAGVKARHIPYKGVGPMLTDLMGGQVDFGVLALPSIQGQLKQGSLRAIGTSSPQRIAAAPEIPTFAEQGLPRYIVDGWFAVVGPKGLPAATVKQVHDAFVAAFATPEVKDAMAKQGNTIAISTPEAAQAYFRSEFAKYAALVKKAGLEPQ
jgi:tripartite-type tricarboxylate transporter receptor subunit TctC